MAKLRVKDKVGLGNLVLLAATDEKTEESLRANPSDLLKRFIEDLPEDHIIKVIKEESNVSYIVIPARDSVPTSIEEKEQILREEAREYDQVRSNVENSKKRGGEAGEGSSIPAEVTENAYALMIGHTALSPSSRPRVTSEHAHSLGRMLMPQEVNFQPGHGTAGRHPTREFLDFLSGHDDPGMFGRMFPRLKPLVVTDEPLHELAEAMKDADPAGGGDNPNIPAGFTYLGQFIDHDITLDLTSIGEKQADPKATENFRTPALDLDSIYGLGPDGSRQLYARNAPTDNGKNPGPKFLIGKNINVPLGGVTGDHRNDLPRSPEGFALIGDHRNDENLVVAQTHLAMLKFHNKICDMVMGGGLRDPVAVFNEARRLVTWHYQWMVLHDFVERLTEPGIVDKILHEGRRFYRFKRVPYIPVEFSAAAYRLGHSMVRQVYSYNRIFTPGGVTAATLALLFRFTGLSGGIVGDLAPNTPTDPTPISVLPSNWIIDWRRFYDFAPPANPVSVPLNLSRKLDPFVAEQLHDLPGGGGSLPFRNLRRGVIFGLPSGQDVAAAMEIAHPLTPEEIATGPDGAVARKHNLHTQTPLWYYILKEAQVRRNGERLGPVGATIVSEVFVGLIHGDHQSYLWQRGRDWKPELPSQKAGTFQMTDLLRLVGDISPIDGIMTV